MSRFSNHRWHVVGIGDLCTSRFSRFFFLGYAWERIANSERNGTPGPALCRVLSLSLKKSFFVYADIRNEKEKDGTNGREMIEFLGKVKLQRDWYEKKEENKKMWRTGRDKERMSEWVSEWMNERVNEREKECEGLAGVFNSIETGHGSHDNTIVMTDYLCEYCWLANS